MVHTGIFATSDEILVKAGSKYSTAVTEARINALCLEAEGYINSYSRYNWSDGFASLNSDVKGILSELESNMVAMYIIIYDMSGYTSRTEAETILDVLTDRITKLFTALLDKNIQDFMRSA